MLSYLHFVPNKHHTTPNESECRLYLCWHMQHYVTAGISPQVEAECHICLTSPPLLALMLLCFFFNLFIKKHTFFYFIPQQDIIKDLFKRFALDLCFDLTLGPSDQCV